MKYFLSRNFSGKSEMPFDLSSISAGKQVRPPRMMLLGIEKIGKSTFASQSNSPCFIPVLGEDGLDDLDVNKFPPSTCFSDVISALQTLLNGGHSFQTVVIDSISTLEPLIWNDVCRRNEGADSIEKVLGGFQKGYVEALHEWKILCAYLDALRDQQNMASILIGHVAVSTFIDPEGPSYDTYVADIHKKASGMLYRWADAILFAKNKIIVQKEDRGFGKTTGKAQDIGQGARFLYTHKKPAHPGGGRGVYGRLPYEIPLSWEHYQAAVSAAV